MERKNVIFERIICVDFDGVIHSYDSGWKGADVIPDNPVPGSIDWLNAMLDEDGIRPVIYSSRSKDPLGVAAMKDWLGAHGARVEELEFPTQKPAAYLTIDDRAFAFQGWFPTAEEIREFKPWNKK